MKPVPILFTQEGYTTAKKEYDDLQTVRVEAVANLKKYREMGDLSENSAYRAAKWKLSSIDGRIRRLEQVLKRAKIVEKRSSDKVEIGSKVTVESKYGVQEFTIVGSYESDISKGNLSYLSPLGKGLMHKKIGDEISISLPQEIAIYKIIKVL
ncbi:MAG: transcription elongation factor GreA [bacterium]|nr:transcription elongation factor GreA [bacterium]